MSRIRVTYQQLIAYAAGELPDTEVAQVEAHLARDPSAAETVARFRMARATIQGDDGTDPPPETVIRARGIYDLQSSAGPSPSLAEAVVQAIARLVFDSRAEPALAGLRGQATSFQLTYELFDDAEMELDLHAELDDEADRWRLVGQIAAREPVGSLRVELCRTGSGSVVQAVEGDERGTFVLRVARGAYDLRLHTRTGVVVVPDIRME